MNDEGEWIVSTTKTDIVGLLEDSRETILESWVDGQLEDPRIDFDGISRKELARDSAELLEALLSAMATGNLDDPTGSEYDEVHALLSEISVRRERMGVSALGTAASIMSLKEHCFSILLQEYGDDIEPLVARARAVARLTDALGLLTYEAALERRETMISRQAEELLQVSTPVVQVWEGVVAAPLIGTLDSERTQRFMERLLESIVDTNSPIALIDITGVPAIDTQTAQHLVDTTSAVRLLGAQVILTGVRPSIAQTLVHLGIDLTELITCTSFSDGLTVAFEHLDLGVGDRTDGRAEGA